MGDHIIEKGGSAGHFAIHSDGATSDGTEMSAFVLGQRSADATGASKISNLLLEMKSFNNETSETRAGDFREALRNTAELCEKVNMAQAELIADLQASAAMNDRAAPERLAARVMLGTDLDGPTCGEHGGRPKKRFFIWPPFFQYVHITNVFCAKKRVGHACICPRMDTG